MAGGALSLYEALQRLRPTALEGWDPRCHDAPRLNARLPIVYIDGISVGDSHALRSIPTAQVRKVQIISEGQSSANARVQCESRVILVSLAH